MLANLGIEDWLKKRMIKILIIIASSLIAIKIGVHFLTNSLLYWPSKILESTPDEFGLLYEDIKFFSSNGSRLHGLFFPAKDAKVTIILFHGNGENIGDRLDFVKELVDLSINVFYFDYQGYGKSEGKPGEKDIYDDAMAAYNLVKIRDDVDPDFIVLFGRSLGGAVAIDLATKVKCYRLITDSTFSSLREVGKKRFPYTPIFLFTPNKYNNSRKISLLNVPVLIIHGTEDETIPFYHGEILYKRANEPKEFYIIEGAGHNNTYLINSSEYFEKIAKFVNPN